MNPRAGKGSGDGVHIENTRILFHPLQVVFGKPILISLANFAAPESLVKQSWLASRPE